MVSSGRIIPARAGFTRRRPRPPPLPADHPRSRGVYWRGGGRRSGGRGSSPLARGLRASRRPSRRLGRIIPARAGFTSITPSDQTLSSDHPRSRGVYMARGRRSSSPAGSSPLARGLRRPESRGRRRAGIIPARAGFTRGRRSSRSARRDHPRSRGVYPHTPPPAHPETGSSPLARGLLTTPSSPPRCARIIPARAGFTRRLARGRPGRADHPRSRGVYGMAALRPSSPTGSSPLARGLP